LNSIKSKGIVIKEVFYNDTDKIITLLLKDYGKISVSAKNARSIKNKLFSGTSLFSYSEFVLYKGHKYYYINELQLIKSFYDLRKDLDKIAYASYFVEIVEKYTMENVVCNDIMILLLKSLNSLLKNVIPVKLTARIFEIKFLQLNGFMLEINNCHKCKRIIPESTKKYFDYEGLLCSECAEKELSKIEVSNAVIYTIRYILTSDFKNLFNFNIDNEVLVLLTLITSKIISYHLNIKLKTYNFIKEIENL